MSKKLKFTLLTFIAFAFVGTCFANETQSMSKLDQVIQVQKYFRAIHIMAMLMVGFGFLMVFVKKYGRSTITATYMMVATAIPLYLALTGLSIFNIQEPDINKIILAEFSAASLLIASGAILGRLKIYQYIALGVLFIPFYVFNEWILFSGGLGLIGVGKMIDTGGSIVIHTFGAIFGLGAIFSLTSKKGYKTEIESDSTSDRFSLLGSMVLWIFWPSFCAALVAPPDLIRTVINVILALSGSTLATYFMSVALRKKVSPADIANATLAGGVAIGSTCDSTTAPIAFVIGALAGMISTYGFAILQGKIQKAIKKIDTCGVLYLHGLPGIFGGLAALVVVNGIDKKAQLSGIAITLFIALVSGLLVGKIISFLGKKTEIYTDSDELIID